MIPDLWGAELLAILLRTGVEGKNVLDLARAILAKAGLELPRWSVADFQKISGMQLARRTARFLAESRPEKAVMSWQASLQDSIVAPKIR